MEAVKKLYSEDLVKEIMISTSLCIQELLLDDPNAEQEDIFDFIEGNFRQIIQETVIAEQERRDSESKKDPFEAE